MNIYKRIKPLSLCVILLLAVVQALVLPTLSNKAYAGSISFKWKDSQTLSVSGSATGDIVQVAPPAGPVTTSTFSGSVKGSKCNSLNVTLQILANTVTIPGPSASGIGNPGDVACNTANLGVSGNQTITNPRPGGAAPENPQQQEAIINLSSTDNDPPSEVKFTLTDSSGKVVASPTVIKASDETSYSTTFHGLTEGDYTLTFDALDTSPHAIHKVKYQTYIQNFGSNGKSDAIFADLKRTINTSLGQAYTIPGPVLELRQNGTVVQSQKSDDYTHTPTQAEKDAAGGATVNVTVRNAATFTAVPPGVYQACIVNTQTCSAVTKNDQDNAKVEIDGGTYTPSDDNGDSPTCHTGGFGLNWILCPVFNTVAGFSDWLFQNLVQPLLKTAPVSTDPASASYRIWSNFRIYGDIFLVIALLVIVFGQSIGGGIVDAYTAKKVLPRLLAAAILINLSIYIVAFAVDITNILGGGLGSLITQPIKDAGAFSISPSGVQQGVIVGGTAAAGIAVVALGMLEGLASTEAGVFIMVFILMPVIFGLLAALLTLILRQAIILALIIVSPVAFALYCLPNTEKYFKKWWEFLLQTLLVYPIVILIFAVSDVLSVTFTQTTDGTVAGSIGQIIAFLLQFLPLLLIPYAFKLAGGAIGRVHDLLTNYGKRSQEAIKGNANDPNSFRNQTRNNMKNAMIASRSNKLNELRNATGDAPGARKGFRRQLSLARMRAVNYGYNDLDRQRKDQNEVFDKDISGKVAAGADFLERAFFARQWKGPNQEIDTVSEDGVAGKQTLQTGRYYSPYRDRNGKYKEHNAADARKAHAMYDGNESKIQALIKYETGKVANDKDMYGADSEGNVIYDPSQINSRIDRTKQPMGSFLSVLPDVMRESGLSNSSAISASTGSFFQTQAQRKELKHTVLQPDWTWKQNSQAFVQDFSENIASYGAATGKTSPINRLTAIHEELQQKIATSGRASLTPSETESMKDLSSIAESLDSRQMVGGSGNTTEVDGKMQPGGATNGNTGGPGRVNAAIKEFIKSVKDTPRAKGP